MKTKKNEIFIKQQNDALSSIISYQSHEVRRPFANILGIINVLDHSSLSEENKKWIELLDISVKELDDIIKTIVTMANYNIKEGE